MATTVGVACEGACGYLDYYYRYKEPTHIDWNAYVISMVVIAILSVITMFGVLVWTKKLTCDHFRCD